MFPKHMQVHSFIYPDEMKRFNEDKRMTLEAVREDAGTEAKFYKEPIGIYRVELTLVEVVDASGTLKPLV